MIQRDADNFRNSVHIPGLPRPDSAHGIFLIDILQQQHWVRIQIPSNLLSDLVLSTNPLARPATTSLDQVHLAHEANHAASEGHHARHRRHDSCKEFRLVRLYEL